MEKQTLFFISRLLGRHVHFSVLGKRSIRGTLVDVAIEFSEPYPRISELIFRLHAKRYRLPHDPDLVRSMVASGRVGVPHERLTLLTAEDPYLSLRDNFIDKQVIDTDGAKVERVNDVQVLLVSGASLIIHVDIGLLGLARRLGIEELAKRLQAFLGYPGESTLLSLRFIQPVTPVQVQPLRLSVSQQRLADLHPGEIADILEELDRAERLAVMRMMDDETAAEVLSEADEDIQRAIIHDVGLDRASDIIEEMEPSEAADILGALDQAHSEAIIAGVEDQEVRESLTELITYPEHSAGGLMTTDFLSCPPDFTVGEALNLVRVEASEIESLQYIYCLDAHERIVGIVSLRHLLINRPEVPLREIWEDRIVAVHTDTPLREVAELFLKYPFSHLPVVDEEKKLSGLVALGPSLEELLPYLEEEKS